MPFDLRLDITAECEDCPKTERKKIEGGFLGLLEDEHEASADFLLELELTGWEIERASYEDVELRCPSCVKKCEAA